MAIAKMRRACLLSEARRAAARSSTSVKSVRVTAIATMPPLANRRSQHRLIFARCWESPHESGLSTLGIIDFLGLITAHAFAPFGHGGRIIGLRRVAITAGIARFWHRGEGFHTVLRQGFDVTKLDEA